jgi:hypothetical protein
MKTEKLIEKTVGKFTVTCGERENLSKYPLHPFFAKLTENRPKAKYQNIKTHYNYVYKDIGQAKKKFDEWVNNIISNIERKEQEKIKKSEAMKTIRANDFFKVGDILVNSWGYEQTNIDFFQVTEVKEKTILVREIYQNTEENSIYSHGMACNVLPDIGNFIENGSKYLLRVKPDGYVSQPKSFYYIHKWSGKSQYKSWYY